MKHAKTLLALLLVLSLSLGLAVTAGAADSSDAPLTVTRVVENSETSVVEIYFSEPVTLIKNGDNYSPFSMVFTNATATAYAPKLNSTTAAKWERMLPSDGLILSADGMKVTFDWAVNPEVIQFSYAQLAGYETKMGYRYGLAIRDFTASADDGFIDNIVAQADSGKKLTANTTIDGMDHLFIDDIEYARPHLTGVDKVDATHYSFNFSEPVNISSNVRVAIRLYTKDNKMTHYSAAQRLIQGEQLEYSVSSDMKSVIVKVVAEDVNYILDYYSSQYDIYIQLIDSTDNNPTLMDLITAVDDGKAALANVNGGAAADAVSWCVTELMYPKVTVGDKQFDAVADALKAAVADDTVSLFQDNDCTGETLVVPAGVTLDLNGKKLTAANVVSFGDVIDSVGGGTLVMSDDRTEALLSLLPSNSMLPLYNATAGGYQFFSQTLVGGGPVGGTATSVKFGVKLSFTDTAAYELLKSGQVKLGLELEVIRDGNANNLTYIFKDATVGTYADSVLANSAGNYYIVLQLSGLEVGDTLNAVPMLETADGKSFDVKLTAEGLTYTSVA